MFIGVCMGTLASSRCVAWLRLRLLPSLKAETRVRGGANPQLASIFGWRRFTSSRCSTTRHSRRLRKPTTRRKKPTVTPKLSHGMKRVRLEPASPKPSVFRNNASTRSSEGNEAKQSTLLIQGEAGGCTARFILDGSSPLAAFRQTVISQPFLIEQSMIETLRSAYFLS